LDTGCVFWSKTEPAIATAEFGNALAKTGEIKHGQRRPKSVLELQNRCSASELNWLELNFACCKPSGTYFGGVRFNGKLIRCSLETHVLSVAKVKLSDFLQNCRLASLVAIRCLRPVDLKCTLAA
jgi:hypothetical protein